MLGFAACSSDTGPPEPPKPPAPEWTVTPDADVYIVGNHNMVMKNGKIIHHLEKGDFPMCANSVFVYGGDVYVAGHRRENDRQIASLWKNGKLQKLEVSNKDEGSSARSVFVSGDNVYVAGYKSGKRFRTATLWINGVATSLSDPDADSYQAEARSVFVSDGDVYVGGYDGYYDGIVWKNGEVLRRYRYWDGITPNNQTCIKSVFVSGGIVYAAGTDWIGTSRAILWKNDEPHLFGLGNAGSVFVSGDDVYVGGSKVVDQNDILSAGFKNYAVLWKNGAEHILTDGEEYASVYSVFVLGDNVYCAGPEYFPPGQVKSIIWVNGEAIRLEPYGFTGRTTSVYAVSRTE